MFFVLFVLVFLLLICFPSPILFLFPIGARAFNLTNITIRGCATGLSINVDDPNHVITASHFQKNSIGLLISQANVTIYDSTFTQCKTAFKSDNSVGRLYGVSFQDNGDSGGSNPVVIILNGQVTFEGIF